MNHDIERVLAELAESAGARGVRLAVAESLTGGLLAASIVSMPGASKMLAGAVVAYDTALKHTLLGVDAELLRTRGPVDDEVARQMARGVREACGVSIEVSSAVDAEGVTARPVDIGVSTTGVAGPEPDPQSGQTAGTVWVGVSSPRGERAIHLQLHGDRDAIREATVAAALTEMVAEIGMW